MIKVTQGQIHINSVCIYELGPVGHLVEIDCRAKYPEVVVTSGEEIVLVAGEFTLRAEDTKEFTIVKLDLDGDYTVFERTGRYAVSVVVLKRSIFDSPPQEQWFG